MYCRDNYETCVRITKKQIAVYENLLSYIPAIKEVVRKFDGKILNKRFDTALREVFTGASCQKSVYSESWTLKLAEYNNRHIVEGEGLHCFAVYIKYNEIYLTDLSEGHFLKDGRIEAEELIKEIDLATAHHESEVEKMKEQLAKVDDLIAEYERIKKEQQCFAYDTDYVIREYFQLNF